MTTINHKNEYFQRMYKPANETTRKSCGIKATCSTCMFCAVPTDYEETGFNAYCIHERKVD